MKKHIIFEEKSLPLQQKMDINRIKDSFRAANATKKLIYINVAVFLVVAILDVIFDLLSIGDGGFSKKLQLPSDFETLASQWWSVLSYMFLHVKIWHFLFNMLCLYWFGQIFLLRFSEKQLIGLYIFGGILGGVVYMLSYSLLPFFNGRHALLCGASASIFAIIVASAMDTPDMPIRFFLLGAIRLKWIAVIAVFISVLGINKDNAGGEIAHIGGALGGLLWFVLYRRGIDLTKPVEWVINFFSNLLDRIFNRKPRLKVKRPNQHYHYVKSDEEYNQERKANNERLDEILDKIRKSGYSSLTEEEKRELFDVSNKV